MRRLSALFLAVLVSSYFPSWAEADTKYQYVAELPAYKKVSDQPVKFVVKVYLQEVVTGKSLSLLKKDGGLNAAGVTVTRKAGEEGASIESSTVNVGPKGFGPASYRLGGDIKKDSITKLGVHSGMTVGESAKVYPDAKGKIFIGTLTIAAQPGSKTTFQFSRYAPDFFTFTCVTENRQFDLDVTDQSAMTSGAGIYTAAASMDSSFTVEVSSK